MTTLEPIVNLDAEQAVLGAILLADSVLDTLLIDVGLRPEHFWRQQHAEVFAAMVALHDAGVAVNVLTLADRLRSTGKIDAVGGDAAIDALAGCAPAAGNAADYAAVVLRTARWNARRIALGRAQAAISSRDEHAFAAAEAAIAAADPTAETTTSSPEQLGAMLFDWLAAGEDDAIRLPFGELNDLLYGGLRAGDVTLVSGWTNHGKSCLVDGILEHAAAGGRRCHLYMNEMNRRDRALRAVASMTGIRFGRLLESRRPERRLDDRESELVLGALSRIPFGMTDCAGWSAPEIARHIRRNHWDIAVVDSINLIPHRGTEEIDEISSVLNAAARQADCHLLVVAQLNQARNQPLEPAPVLRDIRESGKLGYDAANVLFVHREQEPITVAGHQTEQYRKLPDAALHLAKARNGQLGGVAVTLDTRAMRFAPQRLP